MSDKRICIPASILASKMFAVMKSSYGWNDVKIKEDVNISPDVFHFHGGASSPIAWNDVQEINYYNQYCGGLKKLNVPSFPSQGYNQHSHTSEYDGGVLPGITGNHSHASNRSGGLAFACFYPATGLPLSEWEE